MGIASIQFGKPRPLSLRTSAHPPNFTLAADRLHWRRYRTQIQHEPHMLKIPSMLLKSLRFALAGVIPALHTPVRGNTLFIDNTDPRVVYSGIWNQIASATGPQANNYNGTLAHTTSNGASVTFNFVGTRVLVFGMVVNTTEQPTKAQFILDQQSPEDYEGPDNVSGPKYHVKLWESPSSDLFEHTLRVVNNGEQFSFDYLEIEVPNGMFESNTSSASDAPTSTDSSVDSSTASPTGSSTGIVAPSPPLSSRTSTFDPSSFSSPSPTAQAPPSTISEPSSGPSSTRPVHDSTPASTATTLRLSTSASYQDSATQTTAAKSTTSGTSAAPTPKTFAKELTDAQIAGIAVGALAVGQIVVLAALWQRRRRQRSKLKNAPRSSPDDGRVVQQSVRSSSSPPPEYSSRDGVSDTIDVRRPNSDGVEWRRTRQSSTFTFVSGAATASAPQGAADVVQLTHTDGGICLAGGRSLDDNTNAVDPTVDLDPPSYRSTYGSRNGCLDPTGVHVRPEMITKW
ncbi:hypothetical protein VTO73DRAFT_14128 [Trametes versicolor]